MQNRKNEDWITKERQKNYFLKVRYYFINIICRQKSTSYINVIDILRELKSLNPEILSKVKIIKLSTE